MFANTAALRGGLTSQEIANAKTMRQAAMCACTTKFLSVLPQIQEQARFAFRHERAEQREELIAEVIANCWVAFVRLVDRGLMDVPQATPLAQFAIKQVRDGRASVRSSV